MNLWDINWHTSVIKSRTIPNFETIFLKNQCIWNEARLDYNTNIHQLSLRSIWGRFNFIQSSIDIRPNKITSWYFLQNVNQAVFRVRNFWVDKERVRFDEGKRNRVLRMCLHANSKWVAPLVWFFLFLMYCRVSKLFCYCSVVDKLIGTTSDEELCFKNCLPTMLASLRCFFKPILNVSLYSSRNYLVEL